MIGHRSSRRSGNTGRRVALLAFAAGVGVLGAALGVHQLTASRPEGAVPSPAATPATSLVPLGQLPSVVQSDPSLYAAAIVLAGPNYSRCLMKHSGPGLEQGYLIEVEHAPITCSDWPGPPPGAQWQPAPGGYTFELPPPKPGTYVIHVDSCQAQTAKRVTIKVGPPNYAQIMKVSNVAHGQLIAKVHGHC